MLLNGMHVAVQGNMEDPGLYLHSLLDCSCKDTLTDVQEPLPDVKAPEKGKKGLAFILL